MQYASRSIAHPRRKLALAVAAAVALGGAGSALAQNNNSGYIYGSANPGDVVHIENTATGLKRDITIGQDGGYRANSLPIGNYNVTLLRNGATVDTRKDVLTQISLGTNVSFNAPATSKNATDLNAVQVSANALPSIDVSSVDSRTTLSADQLAKLPIARTSISSIALLAPGTTPAARGYGNALSFGGSSASENAYYVNGFQITNPLTGVSSRQLPYDAIDQEQVLIGGYGAQYGRSTGGVINVVSKRGSNEWKGDVQVLWSPDSLQQTPRNIYLRNGTKFQQGSPFTQRDQDNLQYSGSLGGALIKDKLFIFAAADWIKQTGNYTGPSTVSDTEKDTAKTKRWLGKIDWNITDSHILELTGIGDTETTDNQLYNYSYQTGRGSYLGKQYTKNYNGTQTNSTPGGQVYIANYTGYITDDLTINAMYGRGKSDHQQTINSASGLPCPAITDNRLAFSGHQQTGCNISPTFLLPGSKDSTKGWSFNVEYRVGDHDLRAGMDNYVLRATWGAVPAGGTSYAYNDIGDGQAIRDRLTSLGLDPNSYNPADFPNGYFVESAALATGTSARTNQRSQYVEDNWQVTDRWHAYIGLRNEQFTNYNGAGQAYASSRHQLDPRLGVSWDVYGDSSLKIYANAGRYHLGLPTSVAVRGAGPSTYPSQYFGFTGIDQTTGMPTGLLTGNYSGLFYNNGANGVPPDAKTVAAQKLHSYYQDEYILGFDKQLADTWTFGAKAMYRRLRSLIDDTCDPRPFQTWGAANGLLDEVNAGIGRSTGCYLFNPGRANTFTLSPAPGQYLSIPLTAAQIGEPKAKRSYYMLDVYLEHQFSDKWYGKIDYTYSRSYGNSEGQLDSNIVQADVSTTESWDFPEIMENTNGDLPNDQRHQLRIFGTYTPTDEWQLSTVTRVASGIPVSCLGLRPSSAGGDPFNYKNNYYWCNGEPAKRGTFGRTPWTYTLDVSAAWKPAFADHKLTLSADIFNLLGKQRATQLYETGETPVGLANPQYKRARSFQDPRYVRLGARYDFTL